jgi:DNA polymerase-4
VTSFPDPERPLKGRDVPDRRILLVDCDAFFVQVARLADPAGAGQADRLIVGGRGGRGVVTSASYSVRAFGVHSGMPVARALQLCPDAVVVPVPRDACAARSRAIRAELEHLSPMVEAASIDEFYLDLTGTERLPGFEDLPAAAWRIRDRVFARTEIQVSIGVGTNRLVAKLAAGPAKPAGVHVIPAGEEALFLSTLEVRDIPGVGPAMATALSTRGIRTVPELLALEFTWLEQWLGLGRARWLRDRCLGIDTTPVTPDEARKSISAERTFSEDVAPGPAGDAWLEGKLLDLSMTVGQALRKEGLQARTVTVKVRDADFTTRTRARTVPGGVTTDRTIWHVGLDLLNELRTKGPERRRQGTRLLGISVSGFVGETPSDLSPAEAQLELIPDLAPERPHPEGESVRNRTLSQVADLVRTRFGAHALRPGRVLEGRQEDTDLAANPHPKPPES